MYRDRWVCSRAREKLSSDRKQEEDKPSGAEPLQGKSKGRPMAMCRRVGRNGSSGAPSTAAWETRLHVGRPRTRCQMAARGEKPDAAGGISGDDFRTLGGSTSDSQGLDRRDIPGIQTGWSTGWQHCGSRARADCAPRSTHEDSGEGTWKNSDWPQHRR